MKLLIVDDEKSIIEYLKNLLNWKEYGFDEIKTFTSSTSAKTYLLESEPDIMITDICMPAITGLDLAKIAMENKLKTKVIILSGHSDFKYAQQALRLGTIDYLLKPIKKQDLMPVIKRVSPLLQEDIIFANNSAAFFVNGISTLSTEREMPLNDDRYFIGWQQEVFPKTLQLKIEAAYLTVCYKGTYCMSLFKESFPLSKENLQRLVFSVKDINIDCYQFPKEIYRLIDEKKWLDMMKEIEKFEQKKENLFIFQIDVLYLLSRKFPKLFSTIDLPTILEGNLTRFLVAYFRVVNEKESTNQVVVDKIISYIQLHYGEPITLEIIGQMFYMHPVTISKIFKSITGTTVLEYLSKTRMEAAAELLEHSNLLVSDIGVIVGYQKTQYFIKLFRDNFGITPQKYRKRVRLEGNEYD